MVGRLAPPSLRYSQFLIAVVDVPVIFIIMYTTARASHEPGIVAGIAVGELAIVITAAAMTLDRRLVVVTTVTAVAAEEVLCLSASEDIGNALGAALAPARPTTARCPSSSPTCAASPRWPSRWTPSARRRGQRPAPRLHHHRRRGEPGLAHRAAHQAARAG
ncbi:MAG: hypothetical protein ACYC8T_21415 [Myxococcaceae bacterium]